MNTSSKKPIELFAILAVVMAATRFHHLGSHLFLPDASWAVFFLGGFYLRRQWKWAFPLLMLEAVMVDYGDIHYLGVSNYCVTAAYGFIIPGYAALWYGGAWFRQRYAVSLRASGFLIASLLVASSLCYLLTGGSFYWLGGRVTTPSVTGWAHNFAQWYPYFLAITFVYVGIAAVVHLLVLQLNRILPGASTRHPSA